ncbi:TPA: GSCFA domain-containing protein [Vibrio parahaemolyticus]|nr:GSCFA domain-containing protein [Vibrio parahaemolyticus]HCG6647430.1 GSCFA domain-containing protein [Vibrio parahaemolyticus]
MSHPYQGLPEGAFWKKAVSEKSMFDVSELWDPKFSIKPNHNVVTFGSCFAQHIGNALQARGFQWLSTERAPFGMSNDNAKRFNYSVFSARTGNIYTTTLLKQWTEWALGVKQIPSEVWEKEGRFFDPFRPKIEPNGFESPEELRRSLNHTVRAFKRAIIKANYFVFTLGLTESWVNSEMGYEYPMCPGTVAGSFDQSKHHFVNLNYSQVLTALLDSMEMMKKVNPKLKFILTVSPVPLTATNSGKHVVVATMASKATLRAVAEQLYINRGNVDYFPSFELINSPVFKGAFFEPNQRNVNPYGVNFVMHSFFSCLENKYGSNESDKLVHVDSRAKSHFDEVCEEELLGAFSL